MSAKKGAPDVAGAPAARDLKLPRPPRGATITAADYVAAGLAPITLYGVHPGGVCMCAKGDKCGKSAGKHPRGYEWQTAPIDAAAVDLALANGDNVGLRMGEQPNGMRLIALDEDEPGALAAQEARLGALPATLTSRSGGGGQHRIYLWPGGLPLPANAVRALPGVDVRSQGGQIVVAPSMHRSGAWYEWTDESEPAPLPLPWCEALAAPRAPVDVPAVVAETDEDEDLVDALWSRYARGGRHDKVRSLGVHLAQAGFSDARIAAVVRQLPSDQIEARVATAIEAAQQLRDWRRCGQDIVKHPAGRATLAPRESGYTAAQPESVGIFASPALWEGVEPAVEYLCEGLCLAKSDGKITAIYGQPGAGKGPLADHFAAGFALGMPLLGRYDVAHRCKVLLLDFEGLRLTNRRIRRMARAFGRDPKELTGWLHAYDHRVVADPTSAEYIEALRAYIVEHGIEVVVLDSYTSAMMSTGIDSNRPEYALLAKGLASLDILAIVVAHGNKASAGSNEPSLTDIAHSNALASLVGTGIAVSRPDPADKNMIGISCARAPEAKFEPLQARFEDAEGGGLDVRATDAVVEPAGKRKRNGNAANAANAANAMHSRRAAGAAIMQSMPKANSIPRKEALALGGGCVRANKDALMMLTLAGLIEARGSGHVGITQRGKDATDLDVATALGATAEFQRS